MKRRTYYIAEQIVAMKRKLEREKQSEPSECSVCGYTNKECDIINELCSVHTCKECGAEGYATGDQGNILCESHGGQ